MNKILTIAWREFGATVFTKGFLIGLLLLPAMIGVFVLVGPLLFNTRNFQIEGEIAVMDPTGQVVPELKTALSHEGIAARRSQAFRQTPEAVRQMVDEKQSAEALAALIGQVPNFKLIERPAGADIQEEKQWLIEDHDGMRRLALIVIHADAVVPKGSSGYGSYDLYVPAKTDEIANNEFRQALNDTIVALRLRARNMDRASFASIGNIARVQSITVTAGEDQETLGGFNFILPAAFGLLLFMGVMSGGGELLNSTVEEKSSRVVEVLLSAASPMELMAGKLFGKMAASVLALVLYIGLGLAVLTSFAVLGLLNPWLILYLFIFFAITYLTMGSFMMAVGASVNDMREAQSLMMPIMMFMFIPWMLWFPISRDPNSTLSIVLSFLPPTNTFAMMLRMASPSPPPAWQIWLSIAIGIVTVYAALWFTAKVFRIGLLMYGKPPNFRTLIRWVRSA
jgi:ABC-2 type transport system permease protein